jgi:outer membrane protein assembly factor BamB
MKSTLKASAYLALAVAGLCLASCGVEPQAPPPVAPTSTSQLDQPVQPAQPGVQGQPGQPDTLKAPAVALPGGAPDTPPGSGTAGQTESSDEPFPRLAGVGPGDWPQWGGSMWRNNAPTARYLPNDWDVDSGKNIKWVAQLGSQSYGNPVIANGQVYVGTNNGNGWVKRYPPDVDLGCLICFRESDGQFLWQHCNEKLPHGKVLDWELQGVCATPLVDGERLWYVTNRGTVVCLDTQGFHDGENDGDTSEPNENKDEADVIWTFDMMKELQLFQHNMCASSVTVVGDKLFLITGNGVDETHVNIPSPRCPSFVCLDKNTGKFLWGDSSPGQNILHGQWSSPAYAVFGGVPQVMFAGGDAWLYSFHGENYADGKPELLWKFDCNPKASKWILGGRGTRNELIATPVVYQGLVYIAVGQDPEHGEGEAHLWCIDPTKRGDISPQLVFNSSDESTPIPHKRLQAAVPEDGDIVRDNPNSGVVWHYHKHDWNGDGQISFEETMHRTIGSVAIKDDLLFIADFSGLFHCIDAKTGKQHWSYDMLAASWGSPLIADGKVYIGDEDGDVSIFRLSADPNVAMQRVEENGEVEYKPIAELNMGSSVYTTPVTANGVLFIANKDRLFAIQAPSEAAAK